ncbi:MAG: hypothetical protein QM706_12845 [Nitrospira sp.]
MRHLHQATTDGKTLERLKRTTRRPGRARELMRNYEEVMKALARSDRGRGSATCRGPCSVFE